MNSFTNPPVGTTKKFQFDLDFELEEERLRLEMLRQEENRRQKESQPPCIYTEADLESAKSESFQRGLQHGLEKSKAEMEKVIADLIDRVLQSVQVLLQNEQERVRMTQEIAMRVAMASIKKFWPQIVKNTGLDMLEKTLREALSNNPDEARIVLRVHDSLLDAVVQRLPQIKEQEAFNGKIVVIADTNVLPGDSKIEWADGGLETLGRNFSHKLDEALERLVATLQTNSTTERMSS